MGAIITRMAKRVAGAVGSPAALVVVLAVGILWVASSLALGLSARSQLVMNTIMTSVTFVMVFVIQNAQDRDQRALQLKLDELLRATGEAKTGFVNLQDLDAETLKQLEDRFKDLRDGHSADVGRAIRGEDHEANTGG